MKIYLPPSHSSAFSLFMNTLWFFLPESRSITLNAIILKKPSPTRAMYLMYGRLWAAIDCMILIRSLLMVVPVTSSSATKDFSCCNATIFLASSAVWVISAKPFHVDTKPKHIH